MPRLIRLAPLALLAVAACERQPEPQANFSLEPAAPPAPTAPPEAIGNTDVGRDDVALERTMIPELDGVATSRGTWTRTGSQTRFVGTDGVALTLACDEGDMLILFRPARPPAEAEQTLTLLTERGANLFTATRPASDPSVVTARFTAQLPFFRDALGSGGDVIGVVLGTRRAVAIPSDASIGDIIRACR
ncbi:hypothetical protein GGR88_001731 [Sphingomonas jejuensis]|uniref:Uncharacterized protein n=1 Tax=Sphingomonas jejuensis TaxID=904715 RepID=A0ABX0XLL0_9SPHN|nr:hypothetical protein [Sphingomonas jejuensis]NJC34257.1 hypothetical protein [Sphingomonas jejuensis]